ncbi:MAG: hypothetical protein R6V02_08130, partial [Candidatus Aminicenantes bacterium]
WQETGEDARIMSGMPVLVRYLREADETHGTNHTDSLAKQLAMIGMKIVLADGHVHPKEREVLQNHLSMIAPSQYLPAMPGQGEATLEDLMQELDTTIGLDVVKERVKGLIALARVGKEREEHGLGGPVISHHMAFTDVMVRGVLYS